jgi:hypothetical protein
MYCFREIAEAHRRVDIVAQDYFRRRHLAGKHSFDSFAEKLLSKLGITLDPSANSKFEIASKRHNCSSYFLRL